MPLKTVIIKKVYYEFLKLKRRYGGFSDLLLRLVRKRHNVDILYKLAGSIDWVAKEELLKEIYTRRY